MPIRQRVRVEIHGAVQGVGFRPFVYRLATELGLAGWVINDTQGVFVEVEGGEAELRAFLSRLRAEKPPLAIIHSLQSAWLTPAGYERFEIRHSDDRGAKTVVVLPDVATCPDCLADLLDPADRRFRYPFTNCTNCGPRFSIIEVLPYDRPNTSMRRFALCPTCRAEYENPLDRRFHAQPNACPVCGPRLALWERPGGTVAEADEALRRAADALRAGRILAVKGVGGFHMMVDARNAAALRLLRERKPRRDKPFAVMALDLEQARGLCEMPIEAETLLTSFEAPIVLLHRRPDAALADEVAPGNPNLGLMLPYAPLHHLLLRELGFPVVATSGNLADEPICTDEHEAMERLGGIADLFLVHDRPIVRHVDDSVAWILRGEARLLRRARGYAPLPVRLPEPLPAILAVGGHLKNSVAMSVGRDAFISQHIGDLETPQAMAAFERVIADFLRLYEASPVLIAHDLHPDYLSTKWAKQAVSGAAARIAEGSRQPAAENDRVATMGAAPSLVGVQHHHAHLAACLADNGVQGPALGVIWDGTGYGPDGAIWGGEFLLGDAAGFERVAHLRPFRLPGGDAAVHEPRRSALALLWEAVGETALEREELASVHAFRPEERRVLAQMLARGVNSPVTTSAGRLFDGVASLLGLHQTVTFEGQAAMALEFAADPAEKGTYPMPLAASSGAGSAIVLDWAPLIEALIADLRRGADRPIMAARFHNALVDAIEGVAHRVGMARIALSGGCFQNRRLVERAAARLESDGFEVLLHRQVPPNDGGISLGQLMVAAASLRR